MQNTLNSEVIFVHSLFRSGSTYFYNALKRTGQFHVFHEPFHEVIGSLPSAWTDLVARTEQFKGLLRHDFLSGSYFDEYAHLLPNIKKQFSTDVSFNLFFLGKKDDSQVLKSYIDCLINGSKRRPVLQCTRTIGRVGWLKENYASKNIFLLRNPWDQWFSYKVDPYISSTPQLIYSQSRLPKVLHEVMVACEYAPLQGHDVAEMLSYCYAHPVTPHVDYYLFFGLWLFSFLVAHEDCDLVLDMDAISHREAGQIDGKVRLEKIELKNIELHDCKLHRAAFKHRELNYYRLIEEQVLEIFKQNIQSEGCLRLAREYLSRERVITFGGIAANAGNFASALEDASRLRTNLMFSGRELARSVGGLNQAVAERDGQLSSLNQAVAERDGQLASLNQAVAERDGQLASLIDETVRRGEWALGLDQQLKEVHAKIAQITSSNSWKITLPLREGRRWLTNPSSQTKRYFRGVAKLTKSAYMRLPISHQSKMTQKFFLTKHAPWILRASNDLPVSVPDMQPTTSTMDLASRSTTAQPLTVFTICSKNFTAYAKTLFDSVRQSHPDAELYMFLCDRIESGYDPSTFSFTTVSLAELDIPDVEDMAHRYNITEFNTAIKPYAFSYLFEKLGKDRVVYLDPDIILISPLQELVEEFDRGTECVLTPHILEPAENVEIFDNKMLLFGIYNLGFIGLRNTPDITRIVEWWSRRLQYDCVIDLERGLFVDQKWADLLPAFIRRTSILHHPGYNVAYWNLSQRTIKLIDGKWYSNQEPLRFVHFSGNKLDDSYVFSRHAGTFNRDNIGDLKYLLDSYRKTVYANGNAEYSKLPYSFSWNGASGVNLHTPKPVNQSDSSTGEPALGTSAAQSSAAVVPAPARKFVPSVEQGTSFSRPDSAGKLNWLTVMTAARSNSGGWLQLGKRTIKVLRTGGMLQLKQRVASVRSKAMVQQMHSVKHIGSTWNNDINSISQQSVMVASASPASAIPKVFITDWSTPRPDQDAGSVTTFFLLKILVELGYDVTFVPSDLTIQNEYTDAVRKLGVRCLHKEDVGDIHAHLMQSGGEYSAFILFRAPIAALYLADIRKYAPRAKVVLETVDLHYLRDQRSALVERTKEAITAAQKTKDWELSIISGCDVSIVLSSIEEKLLAQELPRSDIRTMPLLFLDMPGSSGLGFDQRKDILFIGGFRHLPNIDAMLWFCKDIWPLVHQRLPEARFLIIGSHPTSEVLALGGISGVMVLGHVKNIDPVFGCARLSVAPLRYGAGIKGKIATSLGYGVPVVGTRIAVEGMELQDGVHAMIADDANSFADTVVRAYGEPVLWNRLSLQGFERVYELYSERAGRARVKGLMDSLNVKSTDFAFHRIKSYEEYVIHKRHSLDEYQRRAQVELDLIRYDADCFYVDGYCAVCREPVKFQVGFMYSYQTTSDGKPIPNWREHLNCIKCGYTNRIRLILHLLHDVVRPPAYARIYATEQTTPLFKRLQAEYPHLTGSEYLGDCLPWGACRDGLRNEDMTRLSFPDESFDLILSCDVLEHVTDDLSALAECYRCLAPGGTFVFTVPCDLDNRFNMIRAKIKTDGTIDHLISPPEYHGNPVDIENGALCFRYFGWEVIDQLKSVGFDDAYVLSAWSRDLAYLGGEQIVFIGIKAKVK